MKTFLTIAFAFFIMGATQANDFNVIKNTIPVEQQVDDAAKIKVHVDFGRKKKGCKGFGICSVTLEFDISLEDLFNAAVGYATTGEGGNTLVIAYDKSSMLEETAETHFGSGTFTVLEPGPIDDEAAAQLGLEPGAAIAPGEYPVEETDESYIVLYNIQ